MSTTPRSNWNCLVGMIRLKQFLCPQIMGSNQVLENFVINNKKIILIWWRQWHRGADTAFEISCWHINRGSRWVRIMNQSGGNCPFNWITAIWTFTNLHYKNKIKTFTAFIGVMSVSMSRRRWGSGKMKDLCQIKSKIQFYFC